MTATAPPAPIPLEITNDQTDVHVARSLPGGLASGDRGAEQNYIYTFYDGTNGTGSVMGTYTGPLALFGNAYTSPSGFVLYSAALGGNIGQVSSTALQPCIMYVGSRPPNAYFLDCFNNNPVMEFQISVASVPTTPGTYATCGFPNCFGAINKISTRFADNSSVYSKAILSFTLALATPNYSCAGFQDPFDQPLSLKQKVQRAIPLKIQVLDSSSNVMTNTMIVAPVVNISYAATDSVAVDETAELAPPVSQATETCLTTTRPRRRGSTTWGLRPSPPREPTR